MNILGSMFGGMGLNNSAQQADAFNRQVAHLYQNQAAANLAQLWQYQHKPGEVIEIDRRSDYFIPATQRTVKVRRDCRNCGAPWLPVCDHCGSVA